jgi:hypothetical protein
MKLKSEKPIHRSFSPLGEIFKHFMSRNPPIMANFERRGINKTNTGTLSTAVF